MRRTRRAVIFATAAGAALVLAGCTGDPHVDDLRGQAEEVVTEVRSAADEAGERISDAGLDGQTRQAVDDAVEAARDAIDEARAALAQAGDQADEQAREALDGAGERLADAREQVAEAAERTDGAARSALESLAAQIDRLADEVRG